jgi:2-oxoisovalerate dehydrogenase E2 component (dihydrolipoyl transacylase)
MPLTVNMPQLGESVTEGTIARWLKHPGDPVAKYESIAEVITDKVNAEIPAPVDGVMAELIAPEGAVVAVGQPICSIETAVPADADAAQAGPAAAPAAPQTATPAPQPAAAPAPQPQAAPVPQPQLVAPAAQGAAQAAAQTVPSVAPPAPSGNGAETYHLTPAVRMLAREHSADLAQIKGSGLGGRITKKDVLEYVQRRDAGQVAAPAPVPAPQAAPPQQAPAAPQGPAAAQPAPATPHFVAGEGDTVVPLTPARHAIAEHMVRSKHTSPHAYLMVEVDMSAVSRLREHARAEFEQRNGVKLTFLPFVGRCVCEALRRYPTLNASWSDDGIVLHRDINLGIAVALEDNLVVPVIRNADRLSVGGLAITMADLGERARSNHLKLDEIQGGTFTLNNTGALGAVMTQAIINQPQAAIMTMDLIVKRAVVVNDAIAIRPMMNLGLSFDHRVNDGLAATRFVRAVKDLLEGLDASTTLL